MLCRAGLLRAGKIISVKKISYFIWVFRWIYLVFHPTHSVEIFTGTVHILENDSDFLLRWTIEHLSRFRVVGWPNISYEHDSIKSKVWKKKVWKSTEKPELSRTVSKTKPAWLTEIIRSSHFHSILCLMYYYFYYSIATQFQKCKVRWLLPKLIFIPLK